MPILVDYKRFIEIYRSGQGEIGQGLPKRKLNALEDLVFSIIDTIRSFRLRKGGIALVLIM